jgi:integrase/recombinase XerC
MSQLDLWAYRRYAADRCAPTTVGPRFVVASEWLGRHPDPSAPTWRDVEVWLRERGLAPTSTRALLVHLRAFYRWLLREGLAVSDPTALVNRPRVPARLPRPAPDRELAGLLERTHDVQLRALYALMACAGLRCVECSRLDWRDVDLVTATVIVNGKGQRERLISMSGDVTNALRALRLASRGSGAVFVGPSGRRMAPYRVSQRVNQSIHAAGYSFTAHQLRHRCATAALQVPGADLLAVVTVGAVAG